MNRILNRPQFNHRIHLYILKTLVIWINILGLCTFVLLRILFYDLPFKLQDELLIVLNVAGWATGIAVALSFGLFAGDALAYFVRYRKQFKFTTIGHVPETSVNKNSGAFKN